MMKPRSDSTLIRDLHELIAALDRRVPRLEQASERSIALQAIALKGEALRRIAELEQTPSVTAVGVVAEETA